MVKRGIKLRLCLMSLVACICYMLLFVSSVDARRGPVGRVMECEAVITGKTKNGIVVMERVMLVNEKTVITVGHLSSVKFSELRVPVRAKIRCVDIGNNKLLVKEITILPKKR